MDEENMLKTSDCSKHWQTPNRLMIQWMYSCGELCACKILEKFNITQPTLSYI